jgi:hypothetical protein
MDVSAIVKNAVVQMYSPARALYKSGTGGRSLEAYGRVARTGQPERFENHAAQLNRWYDVYAWRYGRPQDRQVAILLNDITASKKAELRAKPEPESQS